MDRTNSEHALRVAGHLVRALTIYEKEARRDGFIVPPELPALRDFVIALATARQEATPLGDPAGSGQGEVMAENTPLLNKREAASCLRLSTRQIERLIEAGALASVQIGGRRLVRRTDLDAYVDSLTASGGPARTTIERKSPA